MGRGEGEAGAEKRTTTTRRWYAVRSHIGSDTSNPEATPQIPPSCWTSCSLHNRIRMNRPSPALSSLSLLLLLSFLFILFSCFSSSYSSLLLLLRSPSFFGTLFSLSLSLHIYFILFPLADFPSTLPPSSRCYSGATDAPQFFLSVFAETLRRRPRTKPPYFLRDYAPSLAFPPRVAVSPPFIESCRRFYLLLLLFLSLSLSLRSEKCFLPSVHLRDKGRLKSRRNCRPLRRWPRPLSRKSENTPRSGISALVASKSASFGVNISRNLFEGGEIRR